MPPDDEGLEVKKTTLIIDNDIARQHAINLIMSGTDLTVTIEKTKRKRTNTQNAAIHKYCDMLADKLNDAGLDMRVVLSHHADISWSMASVKEKLWKPVQMALLNKESTTEQSTVEVSAVYNHLSRHLSENLMVYVPWPCKDNQ